MMRATVQSLPARILFASACCFLVLSSDILSIRAAFGQKSAPKLLFTFESFHLGRAKFSPDGTKIVGSAPDGTTGRDFLIWNAATGRVLGEFPSEHGSLELFRWSPDGKSLAIVDVGHCVRLWNVEQQKELAQLQKGNGGHSEQCFAFSPDSEFLAVVDPDEHLNIFRVADGKQVGRKMAIGVAPEVKRLTGPSHLLRFVVGENYGFHVAFTPDSQALLVGSVQGVLVCQRHKTGFTSPKLLAPFDHAWKPIPAMQGGGHGVQSLWCMPLPGKESSPGDVAASFRIAFETAEGLFFFDYNGETKQLALRPGVSFDDLYRGEKVRHLRPAGSPERKYQLGGEWSLRFNRQGSLVSLLGEAMDYYAKVPGPAIAIDAPKAAPFLCGEFNAQGSLFATGDDGGSLRIWALTDKEEQLALPSSSPIHHLAWNATGDRILTVHEDNKIRVWDVSALDKQ